MPHQKIRERNQTIDLMKGIGIVLMIQVHIVKLFSKPEIFSSLSARISLFLGGPFVAPVFMFVMGYCLAQSNRSIVLALRRGLYLVVGGLILNVALNFNLLLSIYIGRFLLNPYRYIFGVDILILAGLSTMIITCLKLVFKKSAALYCSLACLILGAASFIPKLGSPEMPATMYINAFFWGDYEWAYFPLMPWLAYPLLGYAYYIFNEKNLLELRLSVSLKLILLCSLIIVCLLNFKYAFETASELKKYYHHEFLFGFWLILFLGSWYLFLSLLEKCLGQSIFLLYLKWLGRNITASYVFQWLLIGNIATIIYKTQNNIELIVWFVFILFTTSLLIASFKPLGNT